MHIAATCHHCGRVVRIEDTAADVVPCPSCGRSIPVGANDNTSTRFPALPETQDFPAGAQVPEALEPGDSLLGLYRVIRPLGEGRLGTSYLVRHLEWEVDLVMKRCTESRVSERIAARVADEARAWAEKGFPPYLAGCWYVRDIGGMPALFVEYVDGVTLENAIRDRRLHRGGAARALGRVLEVAIQAAWGVHYLHERGELHQNLHPSNILVTPEGKVKVTDPGWIRALWPERPGMNGPGPSDLALSPYAAPEQVHALTQDLQENPLQTRVRVTRTADVWSWALCVLEAFGGRSFSGQAGPDMVAEYQAMTRSDPAVPSMPDEVAAILSRCLQRDPAGRPGDLGEVAEDLCRVFQSVMSRPCPWQARLLPELVADSLNNQAVALLDLGRSDQAEGVLERALVSVPRHLHATYNLGLIRWRDGRSTDEALVRTLRASLADQEEQENQEDGDLLLGWVHLERGDGSAAAARVEALRARIGREVARVERLAAASEQLGPGTGEEGRWKGHTGEVLSVAISSDCQRVLTTGADGSIRLWDLESGRCTQTLWDDGKVSRGLESPDESWLVTYTAGGQSLQVWDAGTGTRRHLLRGHTAPVQGLGLTGDGSIAVSAGADGTVRVWDIQTGLLLRTMEGHRGGVASLAVAALERTAVTAGDDRTIRIWDIDTGACTQVLETGEDHPVGLAVSGDGTRAVGPVGSKEIGVWDLTSGVLAARLEGHAAPVKSVALSVDGSVAVSVSQDDTFRIWDLTSGRCRYTAGAFGATRVAMAPDGNRAVSGHYGEVRVWRIAHNRTRAPAFVSPARRGAEAASNRQAFEDALARAAYALECGYWETAAREVEAARSIDGYERSARALELWAAAAAHLKRGALRDVWTRAVLGRHHARLDGVVLSPDGAHLVSLDNSGVLLGWDAGSGKVVWARKGLARNLGLAALATGESFLCADADGTLRLRTFASGHTERVLRGFRQRVTALGAAARGRLFAVGLGPAGAPVLGIIPEGANRFLYQLQGHEAPILTLALAADGRVAATGSSDGTVRVWNLVVGRQSEVMDAHREPVTAVDVTPDGTRCVSGGEDGTVRLWDTASGRCERVFETGHGPVQHVALAPDGRMVAAGDRGGHVHLWDTDTGESLFEAPAHAGAVTSVALAWDFATLATGGEDGKVRVWHLDWRLEPASAHWDEGAEVWLRIFLACRAGLGPGGRPGTAVPEIVGDPSSELHRLLAWGGYPGLLQEEVQDHLERLVARETTRVQGALARRSTAAEALTNARDLLAQGDIGGAMGALAEVRTMPELERAPEVLELWADVSRRTWCSRFRRMWERRRMVAPETYAVQVSEDGRLAVTAGFKGRVEVWDLSRGRRVHSLAFVEGGRVEEVEGLFLTPEGRWAAACGREGTVAVWDVPSGRRRHVCHVDASPITAACFGKDGRILAAGTRDGAVLLADTANGRILRRFSVSAPVRAVALTPNSMLLSVAAGAQSLSTWDTRSATRVAEWDGQGEGVVALGMSPDGALILSCGLDGVVHAWRGHDGAHLRALHGHQDAVRSVSLTFDGRMAVTASSDRSIRVWDLREGRCVGTVAGVEGHPGRVRAVALTPAGHLAVSVGTEGTLRTWFVDWDREIADRTLVLWYRT